MATKIRIILDRSGSMASVGPVTVDKFNEYINGVAVDRGKKKITVSLYQFDTEFQTDYEDVPVQDVKPLVYGETFVPRGGTALLDAIGKTMADSELGKKDKGICVIITDGFENSSREWTNETVSKMIKDLEDDSAWTFVFLGANQDAFTTAQAFGIRSADKSFSYGNNEVGTAAVFDSLTRATTDYLAFAAAPGMANSSKFFTEEERAEGDKTRVPASKK